ncbi:hypothetical protein TSOC_014810, partial [Tetrabaena socialis]
HPGAGAGGNSRNPSLGRVVPVAAGAAPHPSPLRAGSDGRAAALAAAAAAGSQGPDAGSADERGAEGERSSAPPASARFTLRRSAESGGRR